MNQSENETEEMIEIFFGGDLSDHESDTCEKLLKVPPGGKCIIYFNSPGGNAYTAISILSIIVLRRLEVTGIVTGECSSAALWPFAACRKRIVTPHSVLLFHAMKWQSEEHVVLTEAAEWSRHFSQLESDMDGLLAKMFPIDQQLLATWTKPGRYVTGTELAEAGLAELISLTCLPQNWNIGDYGD